MAKKVIDAIHVARLHAIERANFMIKYKLETSFNSYNPFSVKQFHIHCKISNAMNTNLTLFISSIMFPISISLLTEA